MNEKWFSRLPHILYVLLALVLAFVSLVTHEFVTFLMLGFVVIALVNINNTLAKILAQIAVRKDEKGQ